MFKFESLAGVGDRIRAYDFRGMDAYIEGVVVAKGAIHTPSGQYVYEGYTIAIDVDTLADGTRVGDTGYVAFETTLDYDGRVAMVRTLQQRVDAACAA